MNKVGKIDPACCPPRSQRIPHKPGKVVVQMVVYLPSPLTQRPVLASFLQGGSEDTLSVSELKGGGVNGVLALTDKEVRALPQPS